jgi:serine/threonine protein kinase
MFYESILIVELNSFFRIPPSTSRELSDLITRILKRNPKERIDYEEFFNHPFLQKSKFQFFVEYQLILLL